jgi:hypothetical protein
MQTAPGVGRPAAVHVGVGFSRHPLLFTAKLCLSAHSLRAATARLLHHHRQHLLQSTWHSWAMHAFGMQLTCCRFCMHLQGACGLHRSGCIRGMLPTTHTAAHPDAAAAAVARTPNFHGLLVTMQQQQRAPPGCLRRTSITCSSTLAAAAAAVVPEQQPRSSRGHGGGSGSRLQMLGSIGGKEGCLSQTRKTRAAATGATPRTGSGGMMSRRGGWRTAVGRPPHLPASTTNTLGPVEGSSRRKQQHPPPADTGGQRVMLAVAQ